MLPISDVDYVKPMLLPCEGWPMAAGPVSRLGSFEPGDKTGLRLSPHLAQSPSAWDRGFGDTADRGYICDLGQLLCCVGGAETGTG